MGLNVIEVLQNSSSFPLLEHCSFGRLVACIVDGIAFVRHVELL